ncbi:MAG: Copper amine oxidase N-terminal domain, partial [Paenibacillus sp.]|nr:Copper amine oxidase N-terminal domain [Paenibacillus sp.]
LKTAGKDELDRLHQRMDKKYHIKLQPRESANKIAHLSEQDKADLDRGIVTLLPRNTVARHLPFIRVRADGRDLPFHGIKPVVIQGMPWVPLRQTFHMLGAQEARYDAENQRLTHKVDGKTVTLDSPPVHVLNNFVMMEWKTVAETLGYQWQWNETDHEVIAYKRIQAVDP